MSRTFIIPATLVRALYRWAYTQLTSKILILVHPAFNWTYFATLQRHPCLSRAATSASSQVNPSFVGLCGLCSSSSLLVDPVMWCLEAVPRLEAASRQIFTAFVFVLVLDFGALALTLVLKVDVLALASVLEVSVLVLVLSRDRDQDTNLQGKVPAFGAVVQACLSCSKFTTQCSAWSQAVEIHSCHKLWRLKRCKTFLRHRIQLL